LAGNPSCSSVDSTRDSKRVGLQIVLRSPSTLAIENGILFRTQRIVHAFPATSLPSTQFVRIQAAPYRALERHLTEASTIIAPILDEPCLTQTTCQKRRNNKCRVGLLRRNGNGCLVGLRRCWLRKLTKTFRGYLKVSRRAERLADCATSGRRCKGVAKWLQILSDSYLCHSAMGGSSPPGSASYPDSTPAGKCNDRSGSQNGGESLLALHWARLADPPLRGQ
jgi:hypothetical protein